MPGTHGDLFREIGALVVAAHAGQSIDLQQTSEDLARCYINLGVPAETIARAIARSMAAVSVSMAMMPRSDRIDLERNRIELDPADSADGEATPIRYQPVADDDVRTSSVTLPSGVRIAVLT